ncbi:MAG: dihydrodipicolinate synthase family protein, partial [Bacteroidota bacterium]
VKLALQNRFSEAMSIQYNLLEVNDFLFKEGNPSGLKCALKHMGLMRDTMRPPLLPVSHQLEKKISKWLEEAYVAG